MLLLQWLHLLSLSVFLIFINLCYYVVVFFYRYFPIPSLLDAVYLRSQALRSYFTYRLNRSNGHADDEFKSPNSDSEPVANEDSSEYQWRPASVLIKEAGFACEEHVVETRDGFLLRLYRIVMPSPASPSSTIRQQQHGSAEQEEENRAFLPPECNSGPAVLMMHGLLQNSEAFLVGGENSLAFTLARSGCDVWLGNNRGTKYSHKHLKFKPSQREYWNFSIDDLARYDVPALIEYVRRQQRAPKRKIVYLGFSQGTAQAFACFSNDPELADQVSLFVALSPAVSTTGLSRSVLRSLVESNTEFIYLLFGRKYMLGIVPRLQRILSQSFFIKTCDTSMRYLFGWDGKQVSKARKRNIYPHIFDLSSVKCVEHWFQMMRDGAALSMYQDEAPTHGQVPHRYDLSRLKCPVALFYGGRDTVIEVDSVLSALCECVLVHREELYEHLDFMWADSAPERVFPSIIRAIKRAQWISEREALQSLKGKRTIDNDGAEKRNGIEYAAEIYKGFERPQYNKNSVKIKDKKAGKKEMIAGESNTESPDLL